MLICLRISSEHNAAIVAKIEEAIGTTKFCPPPILSMQQLHVGIGYFAGATVTEGCKTYKKTIAAREKQTSPVKRQKLVRSLKQRVRKQWYTTSYACAFNYHMTDF